MNRSNKEKVVSLVVKEIYEEFPFLWEKYGEHGLERTKEDNYPLLKYLETAFQLKDETHFVEYALWLNNILTTRGMSTNIIIDNFERLAFHLPSYTSSEEKKAFLNYINEANIALNKSDHK
ncbi:hypothetical protein BTS2_2987 [Bacillus sp. TS-2]|nr:hypothetical protein BTS2_2987 [Bacillus sp. TS-2]